MYIIESVSETVANRINKIFMQKYLGISSDNIEERMLNDPDPDKEEFSRICDKIEKNTNSTLKEESEDTLNILNTELLEFLYSRNKNISKIDFNTITDYLPTILDPIRRITIENEYPRLENLQYLITILIPDLPKNDAYLNKRRIMNELNVYMKSDSTLKSYKVEYTPNVAVDNYSLYFRIRNDTYELLTIYGTTLIDLGGC